MTHRLSDIKADYDRGARTNATHMIIFYDSFSGDNYPVYIHPGESVKDAVDASQDKAEEIYKYSLGWESQATGFAYNV